MPAFLFLLFCVSFSRNNVCEKLKQILISKCSRKPPMAGAFSHNFTKTQVAGHLHCVYSCLDRNSQSLQLRQN